MKISVIVIAAALGILEVQSSTAQASAPTAGMFTDRPFYAAGAPVMFKGRGFAPGEQVTFEVTHVRGTPVTGSNHNPAAVLTDPNGGFVATWLVCTSDCVGELLQIQATGQTSGKVARAVFMDQSPPPQHNSQARQFRRAEGATNRRAGQARAVPTQTGAAPTFARIKSLGVPGVGGYPYAGLLQGTDGALYGVASQGGTGSAGTVFKLNPDGTGMTVLHSFDSASEGAYPNAGLIQGTDGALYGAAYYGGPSGFGTVFKLNTDGAGFTVLQSFDNSTTGGYPYAALVQGTDGALYGTASEGGTIGYGTVFKLNTDGAGFTVLQNFDNSTTGGYPYAALVQGTDGALYGTANAGGASGAGTVFKLNTDGTGFAVLQNFDGGADGGNPYARLVQGTDGALYGTAYVGGTIGYGTVFKLNTDGTGFTVLQNFDYFSASGGYLNAGLVQGTDGALYGTAYLGGTSTYGTAFKLNTDGTGFTVLKKFDNSTAGGYLYAGLIQGTDGALYGTASQGGTNNVGTVFKLNADGTGFAVLKHLSTAADQSTTGAYPYSGVMQGTDGALYGTATYGGTGGYGTVFTVNTDGTSFTVLKNFDYSTTGVTPYGSTLVQGTDGALYGTTNYGGPSGYGTVFKLNTDGTGFTVLQNFDIYTTGGNLYTGLVLGTDGALYGTASQGGTGLAGTVFKLNPDGTGFMVLKNFDNGADGGSLYSGLVQGTDGALYGMSNFGGANNFGTVFKLNTDGTGFTVLHSFDSSTGYNPFATRLMQGTDGALYGTASQGGTSGGGTVFKLNTDGTGFTVLWNDDFTSGAYLSAGLVQGTGGALYGTAAQYGAGGSGTLFKLNTDGSDFNVLKDFDGGADGGYPYGGPLAKGTDGNLYGTTVQGGDAGVGTIYRLVFDAAPPPNPVTPGPAPSCLSVANTCITIPVRIARTSGDMVRGFSVNVTLSANLELCAGTSSITEDTYLSSSNVGTTTAFLVTSNGGGSYTVDVAILGLPCGATAAAGTLFNVAVKKAPGPDGTGAVTLSNVLLRDCNNVPIASSAGNPLSITIDTASPSAITDLAAVQKLSGNGAVSTTGVIVSWATGGAGTVKLYRAPFGSYPEYDDDGPVISPSPATVPGAPWVLVNASATSPYTDAAAARGYWYYAALITDACGNTSTASNMTGGTLNYLLGDVSNGFTAGVGDNKVDGLDISLLGAHYGLTGEVAVDAFDYLDVGPTLTGAANARPTPDDKLNFEELIIYAINYDPTGLQVPQSSRTVARLEGTAASSDALTLEAPSRVQPGEHFTVSLRLVGAGDLQGLSTQLSWDHGVAEPLSVEAGSWLTDQNGLALSAAPGNVDVALLGSRGQGLSGEGVLATVTFRALAAGDPRVAIARADARDLANHKADLGAQTGVQTPERPGTTALAPVSPNPFAGQANLSFSLAQAGEAELSIYSVDGRRVRTLARGPHEASVYRVVWNGTDDGGRPVRAGLYFARLTTPVGQFTRRLAMVE